MERIHPGLTVLRTVIGVQTCTIFLWLLIKGTLGQGYYYEGGTIYYPEFSQDDYYHLEPVQYGRGGGPYEPDESMRALGGGSHVGSDLPYDVTTSKYDFVAPLDVVDTRGYAISSLGDAEPPRTYLEGYKQEKTTLGANFYTSPVDEVETASSNTASIVTTTETTSEASPSNEDETTAMRYTAPDQAQPTVGSLTERSSTSSATTAYSTSVTDHPMTRDSLFFGRHDSSTAPVRTTTTLPRVAGDVTDVNMTYSVIVANSSNCDVETHAGCDVIHYERCNPDTRHCQCLNGFMRANSTEGVGTCKAAKFYHGHVIIPDTLTDDRLSAGEIQDIREKLLTLIQLSLKKRSIEGFLDLEIRSVESQGQQMSLSFELGMDKASLPGQRDLRHVLSQDLDFTTHSDGFLDQARGITPRTSNKTTSKFSPLVELDPCVDQEHNHCSPQAACTYHLETVSCQCDPGYQDVSPNLYRMPGEVCIEKCKCHNGGLCVDVDVPTGKRQCSCLNWFFGSECQINGKELLLICCCSIGSLILLGLTMCCCYYGCAKHRDNAARSRMFPFSPDINILKLPRVWMDTTSFHDDLSPQNNRRMSTASERNPYFEGFLMEDIPMGTLQRHSDTPSTYYPTPLAQCPATVSSHSFYRY